MCFTLLLLPRCYCPAAAELPTYILLITVVHLLVSDQVAGTSEGITALQLDTKLPGVDLHLLEAALPAAAAARQKLLASMSDAIDEYKRFLPDVDTPEFDSVQIMKDLVPRLIGPQVTRWLHHLCIRCVCKQFSTSSCASASKDSIW